MSSRAPEFRFSTPRDAQENIAIAQQGPMYDPVLNTVVAAPRFARERLAAGAVIRGPALIVEAQTTTVVPSTFIATVAPRGDIIMRRTEA